MHTLQMSIIRGCKFVTSAHLCTPHACVSARHRVTCHGWCSGVSAVAYIGQIHAINAEFSTPSASRLETVPEGTLSMCGSRRLKTRLPTVAVVAPMPCFVETNQRYTGNEQQLIMMCNH